MLLKAKNFKFDMFACMQTCVIVADTLALDLFKEIAQSKMKITKIIGFLFKSVVKKQINISKIIYSGVVFSQTL